MTIREQVFFLFTIYYRYLTRPRGPTRVPDQAGLSTYLPLMNGQEPATGEPIEPWTEERVTEDVRLSDERAEVILDFYALPAGLDRIRRGLPIADEEIDLWAASDQTLAEIEAGIYDSAEWHEVHDPSPIPPPPPGPIPLKPGEWRDLGKIGNASALGGAISMGLGRGVKVGLKDDQGAGPPTPAGWPGSILAIASLDPFRWRRILPEPLPGESIAGLTLYRRPEKATDMFAVSEDQGLIYRRNAQLGHWRSVYDPRKELGTDRAASMAIGYEPTRSPYLFATSTGGGKSILLRMDGSLDWSVVGEIEEFFASSLAIVSPTEVVIAGGKSGLKGPARFVSIDPTTGRQNWSRLAVGANNLYSWRHVEAWSDHFFSIRESGRIVRLIGDSLPEVYPGPGYPCKLEGGLMHKGWMVCGSSDHFVRFFRPDMTFVKERLPQRHVRALVEWDRDVLLAFANDDGQTNLRVWVRET